MLETTPPKASTPGTTHPDAPLYALRFDAGRAPERVLFDASGRYLACFVGDRREVVEVLDVESSERWSHNLPEPVTPLCAGPYPAQLIVADLLPVAPHGALAAFGESPLRGLFPRC